MKKLQLIVMAATMVGVMSTAHADTIDYDLSFSGGGVSASGIIDVDDGTATGGSFYIDGIANISPTTEFTLLPGSGTYINNVSPTINLTYDNIVTAGASPFLDDNGLVFTGVNSLGQDSGFELWYDNGTYIFSGNPPYTYGIDGTATLTTVPDGGMTVGLLSSALVGLQVLRRKLLC